MVFDAKMSFFNCLVFLSSLFTFSHFVAKRFVVVVECFFSSLLSICKILRVFSFHVKLFILNSHSSGHANAALDSENAAWNEQKSNINVSQ